MPDRGERPPGKGGGERLTSASVCCGRAVKAERRRISISDADEPKPDLVIYSGALATEVFLV
jgi:hypothetical protein